jgi:hypothetical protein
MKNVVLKTYKKKSQTVLNSFAFSVQQLMAADPQFASLKLDIDALKMENDAFALALANAVRGGEAQRDLKNDAYAAVIERLDQLAHGVNGIANGDVRVGRAAGFDVISEPKSIDFVSVPTNFKAKNVDDRMGVVKMKWDSDSSVVNYGIEYQVKGETEWQNGTYSTASTMFLSGLPTGVYINFRVYALGRKGLKSDYTEPATVLVS